MRILVIGLGSMGKRRVRNLSAIGSVQLAGFDVRADRRAETTSTYSIPVYSDVEQAMTEHRPDALIISVPPQHHMEYALRAVDLHIPCFIEASVVDADRIRELAVRVANSNLVVAPSCTMRYFAGPKLVKRLLLSGVIGKPLNINYHTGQYLPDWHPWEPIEEYYVSARATGGCREIVPFELTWLNDVFGNPEPLACVKSKLTDMNADIDDLYHCLLRYPGGVLASLTVDVISRPCATREMRVIGSEGILVFSADENCVRYAGIKSPGEWIRIPLERGNAQTGYINPEEPYIAEMQDFVSAVTAKDPRRFPNTLEDDWRVLQTLNDLEELSESAR